MQQNKKLLVLLLFIIVLLVGALVFLWKQLPAPESPSPLPPQAASSTLPTQALRTIDGITQAMCEQSGGHWNACSSPCRGNPDAICIQMCQPECECGGIAGWRCPNTLTCTDYLPSAQTPDAMGVCRASVSTSPVATSTPPVSVPAAPSSTVVDLPGRRGGMLCDESDSICVPQAYKDQLIGNPLMVTGTAVAFEGTVSWKLVQGNGGTELMSGFTTARQPGVGQPGPFEIRAFFPATYVPATGEATLVLFESSARDGSPIHVLRIPMKLSRQTTTVRLHAAYPDAQGMGDCKLTKVITMNLPRTSYPIEASLRRLLELRPTQERPEQMTAIPEGTRLVSLSVNNGLAKVILSREAENYGGGSCNVAQIRSQIEKTLKEYPSVREVHLSVEGKMPEESLQP